ncbi:EAL domain-containing protein [uncultured Desulfobulbus sp.]|uniref:EAL domain-containing protein n=1 Tax=uncultured Desulfobulbus sp. TaxID=239745 RepID=UPI0029C6E36E|nr:EAL domain-containing protein [uncultured Desulfobulbus sp.]
MSILPQRYSIKYHIICHFSVVVALVLIVSGVTIFSFVYENVRQNMMEKLAIATTSVKDVVENAARLAVRNHLQAIAQMNIALLDGLEQQVRTGRISKLEAMKRGEEILLQQPIGDHGYIYVLSSQGVVQVHPHAAVKNSDLSEQWFVRQQMFNKNGYLEYDWKGPGEEQARAKVLYMLYFEPWDWIVSVSSYRQDFNFLANDLRLGLKSHRFGETGYAFIISDHGDIILHPWLSGNVRSFENEDIKSVFDRLVAQKKGHFFYDWEDQETSESKRKIVFFDYIPGLDWIVASTVYEEEIFAPLTKLGWIIVLIVLCSMALTIPLSLYLGTAITGPLARLAQQMQRATEGDISLCAEENALGEIGILCSHFNYYVEWLRQSNQKILTEITDRIQAEQQLIIYRKAVENALEGIVITDPSATILTVNRAFSEITGYSPEEVIGQNSRVLQSGRHDRAFYSQLWSSLLQTGRWTGEIWNRRKSGEIYPEILSISAIRDQENTLTHYVAVFHDITEMKQQEERIVHQAYHDALTGLPNRRLAHDRIEVSIAHVKRGGTKLAVLFLDLDNFKNVNDTLGHEWGDKLLLQVANRLVAMVREEDTVARLGGDEFLILVAAVASEEMVIDLTKRLLRCFAAPFNVDGNDLFITASIGVAFYPDDGHDPGILTKHADIAMYQAKARGKNNSCLFTSDLSERISYLRQLENNLRQAVMNREFTVFYQPKMDPYAKTIIGAEALVRWQKEDGSIVSPADFIPLAEETGLIIPLGELVLEQACQVLNTLNRLGHTDLSISVNLSPLQFVQVNLVDRILAILAKHAVPPSQLELEITESAMMTNLEKTVATLNQLVQAGISISIDDFGTGYSSLSYLKKFPIRTLKIDRSFIRDLPHDLSDSQLVETIILMAHNLAISVVAEGVETEEQLEWLKRCGCEQIQGYFYSKPLPRDDFLAYVEAGRPVPLATVPSHST